MPDFAMVGYEDGNGDGTLKGETLKVVKLSDYKNKAKIILFNISAGWCGPCQTETKTFKALMQSYGSQGLQIFQVLFDSDKQGERPTIPLLDAWVDVLSAQGAVGIDPARNSVVFNTGGTTPLNMILDARTRVVLEKFNGYNQADVEAKISKHLSANP
jgi:peroxiredoxin